MNKKILWIVIGIVILAVIVYGAYWLGGGNALKAIADNINGTEAKMILIKDGCPGGGDKYITEGHVICWSADGLRIESVDGSAR